MKKMFPCDDLLRFNSENPSDELLKNHHKGLFWLKIIPKSDIM